MKILFATSSFGGGGITSYAKEVISQFSKGNDFSVMIGDDEVSPITTPGVKIYNYECSDLSIKNAINVINTINNDIKPDLILSSNAFIISLVSKYLNDDIKGLGDAVFNSLQKPAISVVNEIETVINSLKQDGFDCVLMSGSGSCVYALTNDKKIWKKAEVHYAKKGFQVCATKFYRGDKK